MLKRLLRAENTSKGFVSWYLQRDVNLFSRERILTKVKIIPKKYKKAGGKYPDLLKNRLHYKTFRIQKYSDTKFPLKLISDSKSPETRLNRNVFIKDSSACV